MSAKPAGLEKTLGYTFRNKALLQQALTHTSRANEITPHNHCASYERLEFVGDALLGLAIGSYLYDKMPKSPEGVLSKTRANIVCEKALHRCAVENLGLPEYVLLGKGEEMCGGRNKPSVLADVVEAILGAIYMDSCYDVAREVAIRLLQPIIQDVLSGHFVDDYKSALQNYIQGQALGDIKYTIISESGPDHDKRFEAEVRAAGNSAVGSGHTKREAEQAAAQGLLALIKPTKGEPEK